MLKGNLGKVLSVSALVAMLAMPAMVNAAARTETLVDDTISNLASLATAGASNDYEVSSKKCTAHSDAGFAYCVSGEEDDLEEIEVDNAIKLVGDKVTLNGIELTLKGNLTISAGSELTVKNADIDADGKNISVEGNGKLVVDNGTITAASVAVDGKKLTNAIGTFEGASASVTTSNSSKAAITAAVTVNKTTLTVTNNNGQAIKGAVTATESTVNVTGTKGKTTVKPSGVKISDVDAIEGAVDATKSTVTVNKGNVKGAVTLTESTIDVKEGEITGTVTTVASKTPSKALAKDITDTVTTVNTGDYVAFASAAPANTDLGVIKYNAKDVDGNPYIAIYSMNAEKVEIGSGEVLIVTSDEDIKATELIVAAGGRIHNATGKKLDVTVGNSTFTIAKDATWSNGSASTDTPVVPGDTTPTPAPGDETISKNPQTSDSIYSVASLGFAGISALAIAIKKRFN